MDSDDPRIRREQLNGQEVLLPSVEEWRDILLNGYIDGLSLTMFDLEWAAAWLNAYGGFEQARLGVLKRRGKWELLPLLLLDGRYYRVHFENVVCEHCQQRCGPSAKPDLVAYAGTGYTTAQERGEFDALSLQCCPHCGGMLRRRQTVWLAAEGMKTPPEQLVRAVSEQE